jgi:hypothetical protein
MAWYVCANVTWYVCANVARYVCSNVAWYVCSNTMCWFRFVMSLLSSESTFELCSPSASAGLSKGETRLRKIGLRPVLRMNYPNEKTFLHSSFAGCVVAALERNRKWFVLSFLKRMQLTCTAPSQERLWKTQVLWKTCMYHTAWRVANLCPFGMDGAEISKDEAVCRRVNRSGTCCDGFHERRIDTDAKLCDLHIGASWWEKTKPSG